MEDVARAAGVSMITVSRALNTPDKLAPATLARVRTAIERLRYVPNLTAGSLASNRSRIVAAIVPTIANSIFSDTIDGLAQTLAQHRYQLLLGQTQYRLDEEAALVDAFLGRRVDGIVLTGIAHARGVRGRLQRAGIPVVETWDLTPTPIDMLVGFSHRAIAEAVCRRFFEAGRRRLAVIGADDARAQRRSAAFVAAACSLGLAEPAVQLVPAPTTLGSGRSALAALLRTCPDVDAVFCSSDLLALGALTECQALRIEVPKRFSLIGFGDLDFARDLHPALTSVRIDGSRIGREAAHCVVERAEGRSVPEHIIDVGFAIVGRATD